MVVSKDSDFIDVIARLGSPPKLIWLSVGNAGTEQIARLIRKNIAAISSFEHDDETQILVLRL